MSQFLMENKEIVLRLVLALVLGMLIGAERLLAHKEAGMKTHSLVSLGAALFIIISEILSVKYASFGGFNPAIMASNIIVGIGFLGAGSIILQGSRVVGLTTAGELWVTAGIGMAAGFGLYGLAIIATILVLLILLCMNVLEKPIKKISENLDKPEN
jgi:putative Mg2+ transporter-C (MgtC) family protein